jgi:hypothetical protein
VGRVSCRIAVLELEIAEADLDGFGVSGAEANECGSLLATVANSYKLAGVTEEDRANRDDFDAFVGLTPD